MKKEKIVLEVIFWLFISLGLVGWHHFSDSSAGKESTCNAGDPGSTPEPGRAPGEGIGYPLQCSWTSLCSAGKESACNTRDLSLVPGLGRFPGEETATHSSILAWRIPWTIPWGHKELDMTEQFSLSFSFTPYHELNDCVSPKSIC